MRRLFARMKPRAGDGSIFRILLRGSVWTILFRVTAALSGFAVAVLSARLLSVEDYGLLQYVIGLTNLLLILSGFGLAQICMRKSGEAGVSGDWGELWGLVRFALGASLAAALALGGIGVAVWVALRGSEDALVLALGVAVVALRQVYVVVNALLVGQGRIAGAGAGEFVRDIVLVVLLGLAWLAARDGVDAPAEVMALRLAAGAVAAGVVVSTWRRVRHGLDPEVRARAPVYRPRRWLRDGAQLMVAAGAATLNSNADILMLGAIIDQAAVGPYHAATRTADFVTFSLAIILMPLAPVISRLHLSDRARLRRVMRAVSLVCVLLAGAVGGAILVYAEPLLGIFGPAFIGATVPLYILVVAQFIHVAIGPMRYLLVMTGNQGAAALCILSGAVVNIACNAILIPQFGANGAAAGTAIGTLVSALLAVNHVRRLVWKD